MQHRTAIYVRIEGGLQGNSRFLFHGTAIKEERTCIEGPVMVTIEYRF